MEEVNFGGIWTQPDASGNCPQKGDIIQVSGHTPASHWINNEPGFVKGVQQTQSQEALHVKLIRHLFPYQQLHHVQNVVNGLQDLVVLQEFVIIIVHPL